ncbi:MAG: type IV conjugative transfer system protein TraL [Candidatus Obscuribacterales bacterium]
MDIDRRVLHTLDNKPRLLFWGIDEFLLMAAPILVGLATGKLIFALAIFVVRPLYTRMKRRFPKGSLKGYLYWHLPHTVVKRIGMFRGVPPSHIRRFFL